MPPTPAVADTDAACQLWSINDQRIQSLLQGGPKSDATVLMAYIFKTFQINLHDFY